MKFNYLFFLIPTIAFCNQKDPFKYHIKLNAYPIAQQQYGGAFNIGFETRLKKINYGVDWFGYNHSIDVPTKYRFDTLMHRKRVDSFTSNSGLAINFSKSMKIKNTDNRFIVGFQAIVGSSRSYTNTHNETFDSVRQYYKINNITYSYIADKPMQWQNNDRSNPNSLNNNNYKQYNANLTLGLAVFCRLEFLVYKRFLFSPEFKLPIIFDSGQRYFNVDVSPGISFNVSYKLGKVKKQV